MRKSLITLLLVLLFSSPLTARENLTARFHTFPAQPSESDRVSLNVTGTSNGCVPDSLHAEVEGSRITLFLNGCSKKAKGTTHFTLSMEPRPFPAAEYTVEIVDSTIPSAASSIGQSTLEIAPIAESDLATASSVCGSTLPRNTGGCCTCGENPVGQKPRFPCTMLKDLAHAIRGEATEWNWAAHLDSTFNNWSVGGSANLPVIAAAIALYKQPVAGFDPIRWWTDFLNCQTGGSCPYTNNVRYMKGHEVMSPLYDAAVVTSVAAAHYWATTQNNVAVRDGARKYLKQTSALYALAAVPNPARTYTADKFTLISSTCPKTYSQTVQTLNCQVSANGVLKNNGPFIAIAGARAGFDDVPCYFDGNTLLARAVQWPNVTRTMESTEQYDVLDYLECNWNEAAYGVNLYGNDTARRQLLRNHILGNPYSAPTLVQIIQPAKFIREYRFVTWPGGQRMTLLTDNPNGNTAPLYGAFVDPATQNARTLYPWPGNSRQQITSGYGRFLPSNLAPTTAEAGNIDPGQAATCEHNNTTVQMTLPSGSPLFQVVVDQAGARQE